MKRTCPACRRYHAVKARVECECGAPLRLYSQSGAGIPHDDDDVVWFEIEPRDNRTASAIIKGVLATATICAIIWSLLFAFFLL